MHTSTPEQCKLQLFSFVDNLICKWLLVKQIAYCFKITKYMYHITVGYAECTFMWNLFNYPEKNRCKVRYSTAAYRFTYVMF